MKHLMILFILLILMIYTRSQTILIGSGSTLDIGSGSDVCAGVFGNISGTITGLGTQCDAPLPVELTRFTASFYDGTVNLEWQTATEMDNFGFKIERKNEESNYWEEIGFVESIGNSNSPKKYSFIDKNPTNGTNSYRLNQVDIDGNYEYSNSIQIEINCNPIKFELFQNYPNPFNPSTTIRFGLPEAAKADLRLYNVLGQERLILLNEEMEAGFHMIEFNASNFSSGVYIYRINIPGKYNAVKKMVYIK